MSPAPPEHAAVEPDAGRAALALAGRGSRRTHGARGDGKVGGDQVAAGDDQFGRAAGAAAALGAGSAKAVGLVLPEMNGKLDGFAVRVATINVSLVDLTFEAGRATTVAEVNQIVKAAAEGPMKGVLGYNVLPLVSMDFNHTSEASHFDSTLTKVSNGNMVKVLAWYDNEWGFSCQMLNTARAMFAA